MKWDRERPCILHSSGVGLPPEEAISVCLHACVCASLSTLYLHLHAAYAAQYTYGHVHTSYLTDSSVWLPCPQPHGLQVGSESLRKWGEVQSSS